MRVGVIGIGFGQAVHVPAFRRDPRAVVVALAASRHDRAARIAERLGVPKAYGDWRRLVADLGVDVVSVAVPPALQPEVAVAAATALKPVLCEKPLALDSASAERMFAAVRGAGVAHAVDFEFAELPAWGEVKRLCDEREFGAPRAATFAWSVQTRPRTADSWKERTPMGGALGGFASHALYLIEWCFGPATRVSSRLDEASGRTRVEAWLECAGGCRVTLAIATDAAHPTGLRFEVQCQAGVIILENRNLDATRGFTLTAARGGGTLEPIACPDLAPSDGDPRIDPVARVIARFIDAVVGGPPMRPDLTDGVRVQRLLDAMVTADRSGRWIAP